MSAFLARVFGDISVSVSWGRDFGVIRVATFLVRGLGYIRVSVPSAKTHGHICVDTIPREEELCTGRWAYF